MTSAIQAPPVATISVVICCYTTERWRDIVAAVASVHAQTLPAAEVLLVVDHAPTLLELASTLEGVRVVPNRGPRGLSGARNTGVAASSSEVVAFLDDDAVADPDWLERLAEEYADPTVLGVGGHVAPSWDEGRPAWFPPEFDWVVGCSHPGLPRSTEVVRNFVGANMSFRRDVLEGVGGFRPDLGRVGRRPVGCEETELCIRVASAYPGGLLLHQPEARVEHRVGRERRTWSYFRARCYAEGMSKAAVARLAGRGPALASERDYVRRVLPAGVRAGGRRGLAVVAGLATTALGYVVGRALPSRRAVLGQLPLVAALVLWAVTLPEVDVARMTDLGLVSVLPVSFWVALGTVVCGAVVAIHRRALCSTYLVGLVLMLHGTPELVYSTLRYSWAWKHVGIVDYIVRHGAVDPHIQTLNAYHAWPGFFALNAELSKASGLQPLQYAGWAPVINTVLMLAALWLVFGTLTDDGRRVRLALLVFVLGNWIGQEYFSPQAFAFVLYLTVLAVCLRWLPRSGPRPDRLLLGLVLLLMVAIVSSHQLTPFMLISALTALVVTGRVRPIWLPVVLTALTVGWIYAMAGEFLKQNLYWIVESIGRPASNTQTTFVDLSAVGIEQRIVAYADRGLTAGMGVLALAGALRLRRARQPIGVAALLALTPLPMLALNNYGGEMLFRVYLFALPFLAFLAVGLIYPGRATRWSLPVALAGALVLVTAFSLAYYGKERANHFTDNEVAASNWLYANAPAGSLVVAGTADFPWAFTHYERYRYSFLENLPLAQKRVVVSRPMDVLRFETGRPPAAPVYVIVTRSQQVSVRYTGVLPVDSLGALQAALVHAPRYREVFHNADATIYARDGRPTP